MPEEVVDTLEKITFLSDDKTFEIKMEKLSGYNILYLGIYPIEMYLNEPMAKFRLQAIKNAIEDGRYKIIFDDKLIPKIEIT